MKVINILYSKKLFVLLSILILIGCILPLGVSAEEINIENNTNFTYDLIKDNSEIISEKNNFNTLINEQEELNLSKYTLYNSNIIKKSPKKSMLLISDNGGTNIFDSAAIKIKENSEYKDLDIQVRSSDQIYKMREAELYQLVEKSDIVMINWLTTDADAVFTNLLLKWPYLSNKELFLVLETSGSSQVKTFNLVKNSTVNFKKIFSDSSVYTNDFLNEYFLRTKRGEDYSNVQDYILNGNGKKVNNNFNKAVLYKNCNDIDNQLNQILWAFNLCGYEFSYENPKFNPSYQYGLFREKYMTLEDYKKEYFDSSRPYVAGLIESNMYVSSSALEPYYKLIESLESKGFNVIPVVAAGGSEDQLKVMVEYFTNSPDYKSYLNNPSGYKVYVDTIVSMPAYGIGGSLFDNTTLYFEQVGVPVFRAVHSDYVSNGEWELSTTGLPGNRSDKWWHVAIGEAQGIIDATFVGGVSQTISVLTGAQRTGYQAHNKNINLFTDRIQSYVKLRHMDNSDKKISLIYYNYPPGKQNIGSSYLDSITSIFNLLYKLKEQGYNVGTLPSNVSELEDMMIKCGINIATWAPGELEKMANEPNVVLLPVSEYEKWFNSLEPISKLQVSEGPVAYIGELSRNAIAINYTRPMEELLTDWYAGITALLPEEYKDSAVPILDKIISSLKNYLKTGREEEYDIFLKYKAEFSALDIPGLNGWGEAPGDIMTITKDGIKYFVIPGLTFGNIFVAPEPQRGWEADSAALYHSNAVAPTHQYLAAFYYMQNKHPSAMVFVGRHATHEWLPGKEVLLSSTDYGSIVVGKVPQVYFYISDGLAEGLQAKRRGFAVMISHLTSPLAYTQLYGNLTVLAELIDYYKNTSDENLKNYISSQIRNVFISNNYVKSLDISENEFNNLNSSELIEEIDGFLLEVQEKLYPLGLHAIGQNWTMNDIAYAVSTALSYDFFWKDITTNLYDEISNIVYSKDFHSLNALERNNVINLSAEVIISLIYYNSTELSEILSVDIPSFLATLDYAEHYTNLITYSIHQEMKSFLDALNGKFIKPGPDGDILDINSLPSGVNFFHDQSQELPTKEAFEYGKILTLLALSNLTDDVQKLVMGIWCVETARDDGALVSVVLYLLGMKPIYTSSPSAGGHDDHGNRVGVKTNLMPEYIELEDLIRPDGWNKKRIDVTVITSGNFRDLYTTQASLMDNAFRIALARSYIAIMNNETLMNSKWGKDIEIGLNHVVESVDFYGAGAELLEYNYVAQHWITDFIFYKELGYNNTYAAECAITRIFAPPNGDFGAGISKAVSLSWTWNESDELAEFYLGRMGNMYSKFYWGRTNSLVFMRALNNTDSLFASRNTNVYGVVDNDDFFDYWGGLSLAMTLVNGKKPNMNVLMYGDKNRPYLDSIEKLVSKEFLTRYSNPNWIVGMMNEGYSGARYISNKFINNLFGWAVTRPGAVDNWMWKEAYDVYFNDKHNIGVNEWIKKGNNNYAFISTAGNLLTAAYEGYWSDVDEATLSDIANQWAEAVIQSGVACCDCSCGNIAMMKWAVDFINPDILAQFNKQLYQATQNPAFYTPNQDTSDNSDQDSNTQSNSTMINSNSTSNQLSVGISNPDIVPISDVTPAAEGESSDYGKAHEINKKVSSNSSEVAMSIPAILAILFLVGLLMFGYVKGRKKDK